MNVFHKPKIVITGASGFLGHPLCALAKEKWQVHAVFHRNRPQVEGIDAVSMDLTQKERLVDFLQTLAPQAVIHAAANADVLDCHAHPESAEVINVRVPVVLAKVCRQLDVPMLFTSTDQVFDGLKAPYDENSAPNPLGVYGKQKARAEDEVLRYYPGALVCRLPLMFGLAPYAEGNFTVKMLAAVAQNRPLNLFTDEYRTPVDNYSAAQGILQVLGRAHGLLHLGGKTRLSRYEMGLLMAKSMQVEPRMIRPIHVHEAGLTFKRALDCSLSSQKAYALGYDPILVSAAIQKAVDQYFKSQRKIGKFRIDS
jgi:dTDP-4-dehydrorhamnose reductase